MLKKVVLKKDKKRGIVVTKDIKRVRIKVITNRRKMKGTKGTKKRLLIIDPLYI